MKRIKLRIDRIIVNGSSITHRQKLEIAIREHLATEIAALPPDITSIEVPSLHVEQSGHTPQGIGSAVSSAVARVWRGTEKP